MVTITRYPIGDSRIAGYGHPRYDEWENYTPPVPVADADKNGETEKADDELTQISEPDAASSDNPLPSAEKLITVTLHELHEGMGGKGAPKYIVGEIKTVQRILCARGIDPELNADGEYGPKTKAAVIKLQKQRFPNDKTQWDGEIGEIMWPIVLTLLI